MAPMPPLPIKRSTWYVPPSSFPTKRSTPAAVTRPCPDRGGPASCRASLPWLRSDSCAAPRSAGQHPIVHRQLEVEVIAVARVPVRREHDLELATRGIARDAPQLVDSRCARSARQCPELAVEVGRNHEPTAVALAKA